MNSRSFEKSVVRRLIKFSVSHQVKEHPMTVKIEAGLLKIPPKMHQEVRDFAFSVYARALAYRIQAKITICDQEKAIIDAPHRIKQLKGARDHLDVGIQGLKPGQVLSIDTYTTLGGTTLLRIQRNKLDSAITLKTFRIGMKDGAKKTEWERFADGRKYTTEDAGVREFALKELDWAIRDQEITFQGEGKKNDEFARERIEGLENLLTEVERYSGDKPAKAIATSMSKIIPVNLEGWAYLKDFKQTAGRTHSILERAFVYGKDPKVKHANEIRVRVFMKPHATRTGLHTGDTLEIDLPKRAIENVTDRLNMPNAERSFHETLKRINTNVIHELGHRVQKVLRLLIDLRRKENVPAMKDYPNMSVEDFVKMTKKYRKGGKGHPAGTLPKRMHTAPLSGGRKPELEHARYENEFYTDLGNAINHWINVSYPELQETVERKLELHPRSYASNKERDELYNNELWKGMLRFLGFPPSTNKETALPFYTWYTKEPNKKKWFKAVKEFLKATKDHQPKRTSQFRSVVPPRPSVESVIGVKVPVKKIKKTKSKAASRPSDPQTMAEFEAALEKATTPEERRRLYKLVLNFDWKEEKEGNMITATSDIEPVATEVDNSIMPEGGGFGNHTDFETAVQRLAESGRHILGCLGNIVAGGAEAIPQEAEHILDGLRVIHETIKGLGSSNSITETINNPLGNDMDPLTPGYEQDEAANVVRDSIASMRNASEVLRKRLVKAASAFFRMKNNIRPQEVYALGETTLAFLLGLLKSLDASIEGYPGVPVRNLFASPQMKDGYKLLYEAVRDLLCCPKLT